MFSAPKRFFRKTARAAFSMVEVALAIGIVAFTLVSVLALLPVGVDSDQTSAEATRASAILTTLEADLRDTHPALNQGKSLLYGLTLPYALDGTKVVLNPQLSAGEFSSAGLDDTERVTAPEKGRYQASVIFVKVPAGGLEPVVARLVVGWPGRQANSAADLTSKARLRGFVETYVTFPAP